GYITLNRDRGHMRLEVVEQCAKPKNLRAKIGRCRSIERADRIERLRVARKKLQHATPVVVEHWTGTESICAVVGGQRILEALRRKEIVALLFQPLSLWAQILRLSLGREEARGHHDRKTRKVASHQR